MNIIIIDDDFIIRHLLKSIIASAFVDAEVNMFTSANGVEGLGYIMVSKPDIILIDSTLPKYSGKEVLEFLASNVKLKEINTKVIVLHEGEHDLELPAGYVVLDKFDQNFAHNLLSEMGLDEAEHPTFIAKLSRSAIRLANRADLVMHKKENTKAILLKPLLLVAWLSFELRLSFILSILQLLGNKKVKDANIAQAESDVRYFRVQTYPTIATIFMFLIFTFLQVSLFFIGGLTLFNVVRIQSAFALTDHEKGFEFKTSTQTQYSFDANAVVFKEDGVELKGEEVKVEGTIPAVTAAPQSTTTPEATQAPTATAEPTVEATQAPTATATPEPTQAPTDTATPTPTSDVQGISDENLDGTSAKTTSVTKYSTDKPALVTKYGVAFSNLKEISERSNINTDETSKNQDFKNTTDTNITYQLSPDKDNWYYFNKEETRWSKTSQGSESSNTIQEVNAHLGNYEDALGGSGILYLKIYLHSNGSSTPKLKEVVVDRDVELISTINNELPAEPKIEEVVLTKVENDRLEVELFNISDFNGEKVIKGKWLLKDKKVKSVYNIDQSELNRYQASVYFSNKEGTAKGDLIGTTDLYLNSRGEIEFLLRTPARAGGFVMAEIVEKPNQPAVAPTTEAPASEAPVSSPTN
jgi:CheY-like chemotaxis protein